MRKIWFSVTCCLVVVFYCIDCAGQRFTNVPDSLIGTNMIRKKNQLYMALAARRQHKESAVRDTAKHTIADTALVALIDKEGNDINAYQWFNVDTYNRASFCLQSDKNKITSYHANFFSNTHEKVIIVGQLDYLSEKKVREFIFIDEGADGTVDGYIKSTPEGYDIQVEKPIVAGQTSYSAIMSMLWMFNDVSSRKNKMIKKQNSK